MRILYRNPHLYSVNKFSADSWIDHLQMLLESNMGIYYQLDEKSVLLVIEKLIIQRLVDIRVEIFVYTLSFTDQF